MRDLFTSSTPGTARSARVAGITTADIAARIVDPAPEVANLTTGQFLRGRVVGQDEAGLLIVQTRLAIVKLAAARSLAIGSEVVLQVRSGGAQPGVTLLPLDTTLPQQPLPVDGRTINGAQDPLRPGMPPPPAAHPAQAPQAVAPATDFISRASLIRAVLQAAPPLPLLAGLPSADPGTELLLRILSIGSPGQNPRSIAGGTNNAAQAGVTPTPTAGLQVGAGLGKGLVPSTTAGAQQSAGPAPAAGPASTATGLAPQNAGAVAPPALAQSSQAALAPATGAPQAGLRLAPQATVIAAGHNAAAALQSTTAAGVAPAIGAAAGPAADGAAEGVAGDGRAVRLTGLVTTGSSAGPTILHTPLGTLTLKASIDLPPGSSLALEVLLPSSGKAPLAPIGLGASWPGPEMIEEALLAGLPVPQAEALQRALPQVGPRLGSGMLFFLSAITQGNPLGWLAGPAAALERSERGDFLDRLGREIAGLSRSVETSSGEWRLLQLPIWSDEGLRELRMFLRQQEGRNQSGEDGTGDKATRFVLELELKHYGELQLDGLVRPQQFDLILRSRHRLPAVTRGDLMALFEETNAIAGYRGQLLFQTSQDWMQLLAAQSSKKETAGLEV